jgi:hypothetical protein
MSQDQLLAQLGPVTHSRTTHHQKEKSKKNSYQQMKVSLNNSSTKISRCQVAVENCFLEEQHALVDLV